VVALVTGAARGIGRAIAEELAGAGYAVALADVDRELGQRRAAELASRGHRARFYPLDVRRVDEVAATFGAVATDLGPPTALVNNAGIYPDHGLLEMPEAAWDAVLDTNLKGTFLCAQAFARARVTAGGGGAVVNLASTAAFSARPGAAHYSASKAGVVMLTRSLALELAPHRIRVNAVAPGLVEVEGERVSRDFKAQAVSLIPAARMGEPAEIARVVRFLLSGEADFMTGACVTVDGGFLTGRMLMRSGAR
jgi:3-oxoacyl-[acyl-carrier protein] reductase